MTLSISIILKFFQYFGFILAELTNALLLYLITTKASSKFGSYKYLMIAYAVYSMIYAVVEIFAQPGIHVQGSGFIMFVGTFLKNQKMISTNLIVLYCGSFGICISLLTSHFVFRYIAVCRPRCLYLLEGKRLILLLFPCLIIATFWYTLGVIIGSPTEWKSDYFRTSLKIIYHENIDEIGYLSLVYHDFEKLGTLKFHLWDLCGLSYVCFIMNSLLAITIFCGYQTFKKVFENQAMSAKTRDLNNQLFRALLIQFLVPLFTLLIPAGALMTLPLFRIDMGELANICAMNAAMYPGVDALITILLIRDFRSAVFCRRKNMMKTTSTHDTVTYS